MNRLRRWLAFKMTPTPTTMDPTSITSTFDLLRPENRTRTPIMHLARNESALVLFEAQWESLGVLAIGDGGWEPTGTDAENALPVRSQFEDPDNPMPAGSYRPLGQTIAASDARAMAAGIRRALATGKPDYNGAESRRLPLTRFFANRESEHRHQTAAPLNARYWDAHLHAETIATFLDGGSCRIMRGLPQQVHDDDKERERVQKLEREAARLAQEVEHGPAARLAGIRAELAATPVGPVAHSTK